MPTLTKRMQNALIRTRAQMEYEEADAKRASMRAQNARAEGRLLQAVDDFYAAAQAYTKANGYAIALQDTLRGLGADFTEERFLDLQAKQGRYARLASDAERDARDVLHGPIYRALHDLEQH